MLDLNQGNSLKTLQREAPQGILSNCHQFIRCFQASSCPSVGLSPHLNGEEIGLSALPWPLPAFSFPDRHACYNSTGGTDQHSPKCGAPTASLRKSQGVCLKCRFPGYAQAYCISTGGRDKAGRNLYFNKHLGWLIGTLKFENHQYSLVRTILSWIIHFPALLGLRRNEQWRYKFSRKQLSYLIDMYWMARGCQALF